MTRCTTFLAEPALSEIGVSYFIEQLYVVDVADDICQLLLGELGPLEPPVTHRIDHSGRVVPEKTRQLLQAAAGPNSGEIGTQGTAVPPDRMALRTVTFNEDAAACHRITGEKVSRLGSGVV
jgi:hypothetical protein